MGAPVSKRVERLARIETRSRQLAQSGNYPNSQAILMAMLAEGFTEAAQLFKSRWTRGELDRICEVAFRRPTLGPHKAICGAMGGRVSEW
jgi:hypothetical protein